MNGEQGTNTYRCLQLDAHNVLEVINASIARSVHHANPHSRGDLPSNHMYIEHLRARLELAFERDVSSDELQPLLETLRVSGSISFVDSRVLRVGS